MKGNQSKKRGIDSFDSLIKATTILWGVKIRGKYITCRNFQSKVEEGRLA